MPNHPTDKTRRPRAAKREFEDWIWQLFVKACGERCCSCLKAVRLQRGHIQRAADGGLAAIENLIPLCKACNSKYKDGFTPDDRPADWHDTFVKLFLAETRLGICVENMYTSPQTVLRTSAEANH